MTPIPASTIEAIKSDFLETGTVSSRSIDLLAAHAATGAGAAPPINWAQLFQVLLPILLQILSGLFPAPAPKPTP